MTHMHSSKARQALMHFPLAEGSHTYCIPRPLQVLGQWKARANLEPVRAAQDMGLAAGCADFLRQVFVH